MVGRVVEYDRWVERVGGILLAIGDVHNVPCSAACCRREMTSSSSELAVRTTGSSQVGLLVIVMFITTSVLGMGIGIWDRYWWR